MNERVRQEAASTDEKVAEGGEESRQKSVVSEGAEPTVTMARVLAMPGFKTADAFFAALAHQKADSFAISGSPSDQPIWICNRDDKVHDVLSGMIKRNIGSVPVLLKSSKYYVVRHFGGSEFAKERSFFDLLNEEKKFLTKTVGDLMDAPLSFRNPYHPIPSGYSAFAVVEALARERGLHRVPVIDSNRHVMNLVTQSQVVRFLNENVEKLGSVGLKTVKVCQRLFKEVLSVKEDSLAIDAFNLMCEKNVQGIAIRNDAGRLRGNLSLRDLKLCSADMSMFWRLHQTVKNFVTKLRHEYQLKHDRPRQVVYVTPSSTISEVIKALAEHQIHRLYICDNHQDKIAIGVITLQDVLLEIIES